MIILAYFSIFSFIFLFGICIGSFLNVIIFRLPKGILLFKNNRSFCFSCKEKIAYYDLIPLLSYFILGGKCRNCKAKISIRYPLVEFATGLIACLCLWQFGLTLKAFCAFTVGAIFICISLIDMDRMEIPNQLTIALIVPAVASVFLFNEPLSSRFIGLYAVSLPMLGLSLIIPTAFGFGDIKLIAVCGFLLGIANLLAATFIAIVSAGIPCTWIIISKKHTKGQKICFGPYICLGCYIALFWGKQIIKWYLGFY